MENLTGGIEMKRYVYAKLEVHKEEPGTGRLFVKTGVVDPNGIEEVEQIDRSRIFNLFDRMTLGVRHAVKDHLS